MRSDRVGDEHQQAVEDGVPRHDGDIAFEIAEAELLQEQPEGDSRDGCEHNVDGELALVRDLAPEQLERADGDAPNVAPEIDEDGE